jgi:hypothetical protein
MTAQDSRTRESKALEARLWLRGWLAQKLATDPSMRQREDFCEMVVRLLNMTPPWELLLHYQPEDVARCWGPGEVLPHCPPDVALQRFRPAERIADLSSEERILALPDDVLRGFSAAYLDTLSERVRQAIDARLTGLNPPSPRDRGALDESDDSWMHVVPPDTRPEELHRLLETIPTEDVLAAFRRRRVVRFFGIENLLRHFADDDVVRHYAPAERLAGLSREEQILAMPDQVLHGLTEEYVRTLPGHAPQAIQARLAGDS